MESARRIWNKRQKELRRLLESSDQFAEAIQFFLSQHSALHASQLAGSECWSFEDEVLDDMGEEQIRRVPENCEHSVAWNIWHIARIEDTAMNMLAAGCPQVLSEGGWFKRLNIEARDTGNLMSYEDVIKLSETIDIEALRAYRTAVGRRTRKVIEQLSPDALAAKVDPSRLQKVLDEGAVVQEAQGLIDYWSKRTIAGLLLMPATRHSFGHLNEALKLKKQRN